MMRPPGRVARWFYLAGGLVMLGLGIIGALLPVMPTTIFLILAAWCFARSSSRLEAWLLRHRRFGPVLLAWRQEGAIPRRGKVMACVGMALGLALFWLAAHPGMELALLMLAGVLASAWYVVSRPEPQPNRRSPP